MSKKKAKWSKKRHAIAYFILRPFLVLLAKTKWHCHYRKLKFDHKQQYFILCNHQTDYDPLIIQAFLDRFPYTICTDTLMSNGLSSRLMRFFFNMIPIRKGAMDAGAVMNIMRVIKEGKDIVLFPEGNRAYAEFQYPIKDGLVRLIKKSHVSLMLLNIEGGTGVSPRFAHKDRKGTIECKIKRILSPEEMAAMEDEKLLHLIQDDLRVFDSESGQLFKSDQKAEYLERMLFYCPKCHKMETLHSEGNELTCSCSLKISYEENLSLKSDDPSFPYTRLIDWYDEERHFIRDMEIHPGEIIFSDPDVRIYTSHLYQKRKLVSEGKMSCSDSSLTIGSFEIPVSDIQIVSPVSGTKIALTTKTDSYFLIGHPRFNPLKYVFLIHRLNEEVRKKDIFYPID